MFFHIHTPKKTFLCKIERIHVHRGESRWRMMAQLPKGGLVRGHDKPIHGSCAICFPGGIIRTTFSEKYNFLDIRGLTIATWIAGFGCLEIRGPGGTGSSLRHGGSLRHSELREVAFPATFLAKQIWKGRRKPRLAMLFLCVCIFSKGKSYIYIYQIYIHDVKMI